MSIVLATQDAADLLYREALYLDRREWEAWLALYVEDCIFWMPAWRDETTTTKDPDAELSLIYYRGRRNLEDRVWRVKSGMSIASTPLPRSVHGVTNVLVEQSHDGNAAVSASFTVHRFDARSERSHVFFGRYDYLLINDGGNWRIASKTITLMNDLIPTVVDFHTI